VTLGERYSRSSASWTSIEGVMPSLRRLSAEMSLNVLAYNLKRVIKIIGSTGLMKALMA
jgi:hypothetical protein